MTTFEAFLRAIASKAAQPPTYGLLLWGQTKGDPGITPLFSFGYAFDR